MPRVVELNCVEHLQMYRLAWSSLWQRTKHAAFTQTLDWFTAYCRFDESVIRPRALLILGDDDEVLGVLPLAVHEERTPVGTLRVLGYPSALGLDRCGAVGNQVSLTLWEGLRHVAESPRDWDVLDLQGISGNPLDGRRMIGGLRSANLDAELDLWREQAVVELASDWASYCAAREPVRAQAIADAEERLDQAAATEYVRYRPLGAMHGDDDPRWDWFDDCMAIAAPAEAELFRAAHEAAAKVGALDMNLLYVEGVAAAYVYNYFVDGVLTTVAAGCDPRFATVDAGAILRWAMLRQSHELGDRTLELSADEAESPFWRTGTERLLRAVHYPPRALRAQALRFGRAWRQRLTWPMRIAGSL